MEKELTPFQNVLVGILTNNFGFTHKYFNTYTHPKREFDDINVSKMNYWDDVIRHFFQDGKQQKVWELKRVLEVQ